MSKKITLFQMKSGENGRFMPLAEDQTSVDLSKYKAVWAGSPEDLVSYSDKVLEKEGNALLECLFDIFNRGNRPGAKEFCSMSVSDVVQLENQDGKIDSYYCDSFGFKKVDI